MATAKRFANEGACVFITGRREPELAAAVKEIGRNIIVVGGNVSNLDDLDRHFARIKREKGGEVAGGRLLGLLRDRILLEFTQHTGDEMYRRGEFLAVDRGYLTPRLPA